MRVSVSTLGGPMAAAPSQRFERFFPFWLRAFVRTREIGLVLAALFIGAMSGLLVAAMGQITQIMHVILFGFPIDERLSAQAGTRVVAGRSGDHGGRCRTVAFGLVGRQPVPRPHGRCDRGQCVAWRPAVAGRFPLYHRADADLERLRHVGRSRSGLYADLRELSPRCSGAGSPHGAAICACLSPAGRPAASQRPSARP